MTRELTEGVSPDIASELAIVVENDAPVRRLLFTILTRLGYSVLTARDATDALRAGSAASGAISLGVIELELPDARGIDLARQLGAMHPGMRVVFVGADADDETVYSAPPSPLLKKPFHPQELARIIEEAKHSRPAFGASRQTCGCGGRTSKAQL